MPTIARQLRIEGLVQGVGYRWAMVEAARRLGVDGWVRNRRDGSVEALASGEEDAVLALIEWSRQGPPGARIDLVTVEIANAAPAPGFAQRETA
jgi:acylphosphatase